MSKYVGKLTVHANDHYHQMYEYAGAGAIWQLPDAVIDVYWVDNYWVCGQRPGICIESWFQNRIGASLGSDNRKTEPVPGTVSVQMTQFDAGKLAADGLLELSSKWRLVTIGEYDHGELMYRIQPV